MLDLKQASDVFCRSFAFTRSFTHPYEFVNVEGLRIMRDATQRREPRIQQIVVCGLEPDEALAQIAAYNPPRHCVCAMLGKESEGDLPRLKTAYKVGGYRFLGIEGFFVRDLSLPIEPPAVEVRRVASDEEAGAIAGAARTRQILPHQLTGSEVRLYGAWQGTDPMGWVRSIHLQLDSTWASNLFVRPEHRRKGVGKALMSRMLKDDIIAGAKHSVLLASTAGSLLYPQVGYDWIGVLLLFVPKKG